MGPSYSQVIEDLEARAYEAREDRVERIRYSGYAIMMRDLLMAPLQPISDVNLRKLWSIEGLIWTR